MVPPLRQVMAASRIAWGRSVSSRTACLTRSYPARRRVSPGDVAVVDLQVRATDRGRRYSIDGVAVVEYLGFRKRLHLNAVAAFPDDGLHRFVSSFCVSG